MSRFSAVDSDCSSRKSFATGVAHGFASSSAGALHVYIYICMCTRVYVIHVPGISLVGYARLQYGPLSVVLVALYHCCCCCSLFTSVWRKIPHTPDRAVVKPRFGWHQEKRHVFEKLSLFSTIYIALDYMVLQQCTPGTPVYTAAMPPFTAGTLFPFQQYLVELEDDKIYKTKSIHGVWGYV